MSDVAQMARAFDYSDSLDSVGASDEAFARGVRDALARGWIGLIESRIPYTYPRLRAAYKRGVASAVAHR